MKSFKEYIQEKIVRIDSPPDDPLMILINPNKVELNKLLDFAVLHSLEISNFSMGESIDLRFVYDIKKKDMIIWTGFALHDKIKKLYSVKEFISGFARFARGGLLFSAFGISDSISFKTAEKLESEIKKRMLRGSIKTNINFSGLKIKIPKK